MDLETGPGELERPHRRQAERRLEALANNALLRVAQFLVTGIAMPLIGWGMTTVIERLNSIEAQLVAARVASATTELRMLANEKGIAEISASQRDLRERVLSLEFMIRDRATLNGNGNQR